MHRFLGALVAIIAVTVLSASLATAAPVVQNGWLPSDKGGHVRFREFVSLNGGTDNSFEVGLYDDDSSSQPEAQIDFGGADDWQATNYFEFSYDGTATATVKLWLGGDQGAFYTNSIMVTPQPVFNYMQISVFARDPGTTVTFSDLLLDTNSLGDFSTTDGNDWYVTGFDFSNAFTVKGDLDLAGAFSASDELGKAEIRFGYAEGASAVPVPAAVWLLGSGLVGLAGLRRKMKK